MTPLRHNLTNETVCDRVRILIVDNEDDLRTLYAELIAYWGWQPYVAQGQGETLLKQAEDLARRHRCHLALLDMRLADDHQRDDHSGLDLIPKIMPTESIVVSGFLDNRTRRHILNTMGARSFVGKEEDPENMKAELEKAARSLCAVYRGLECEAREDLRTFVRDFYPDRNDIPADEALETLARLFPDAKKLEVKLMESAGRQRQSQAPRPRSKVLLVRADDLQPKVVKLARAQKISKEVQRYDRYIAQRLKGGYSPPMDASAVLWDLGGAVYPFMGSTRVQLFSAFYRKNPEDKILQSLKQFFTETWSPWYREGRETPGPKVNIFEAYCKVWGRDWYETLLGKANTTPFEHPAGSRGPKAFPNPIAWLKERIERPETMPVTGLAVTHGDLHGANMLVDEHNNIWAIDFERSGPGPILQDFAELEGDILLRLAGLIRNDFNGLYTLSVWAARSKTLTPPPGGRAEMSAAVQKSMQVIAGLRRIAAQCSGENDAQPYLWGVLLNALFRASLLTTRGQSYHLRRALMLSSILCHRLDHWSQQRWPPAAWNSHE